MTVASSKRSWLRDAFASELPTLRAYVIAAISAISLSSFFAYYADTLNWGAFSNSFGSTLVDYISFYTIFIVLCVRAEHVRDSSLISLRTIWVKFLELLPTIGAMEIVAPFFRLGGQWFIQVSGYEAFWASFIVATSTSVIFSVTVPPIRYLTRQKLKR